MSGRHVKRWLAKQQKERELNHGDTEARSRLRRQTTAAREEGHGGSTTAVCPARTRDESAVLSRCNGRRRSPDSDSSSSPSKPASEWRQAAQRTGGIRESPCSSDSVSLCLRGESDETGANNGVHGRFANSPP
jgi:hypothetical protein